MNANNSDISTIKNPVFVDEIHFPIEKVITVVQGSDSDAVSTKLQTVSTDNNNLFELIKIGDTAHGGIGINSTSICHNTVDMRDSFRMFVDLSDPTKKYALICLTGSSDKYNKCKSEIKTIFNSNLNLNVENVFAYKFKSTYDKFGNCVVSPPTPKDTLGTIILGSQTSECIAKVKNGAENALVFSWMPSCNKDESSTKNLNKNKKSKRETYCTTQQSYDFSSIPKKGPGQDQDGISEEFRTILNNFKQRHIEIFTGWLEVGHADEIISFIPYSRANSTHGFKILIASPAKFLELWETASTKEASRDLCLFNKPLLTGKDTQRNQLLTVRSLNTEYKIGIQKRADDCDILVKDYSDEMTRSLIEFNRWLQTAILNKIKQQLIEELGVTMADFIDIPILYIGPDELLNYVSNGPPVFGFPSNSVNHFVSYVAMLNNVFGVYHISNNFINSLYSTNYIVAPEMNDNIGCETYITDQVKSDGGIQQIYFKIDEWDTVKWQHGGLHCYTTESRNTTNLQSLLPWRASGGKRKKTRKTSKKYTKKSRKSRRHT
jgi:hypothetical protein